MKAESPAPPAPPPSNADAVLEFLLRLGQAYLACGEQTAQVELLLRRIASAYGMRKARIVTFPTAIFIALHEGDQEHVTLSEGAAQALRLDQIAEIYSLGSEAQRGEMIPRDGLKQLTAILRKPPRFGPLGSIVGHTILSVGLAIVLTQALSNLAAAAALGTIVGIVRVFNRSRTVLAVPYSVAAATLVSFLVYLAAKWGLAVNPNQALIPPLVTFLPGAMLTMGMVELAFGDMVSGSSRLLTGFVQLILLAFGLAAGAALAGVSPDTLLAVSPDAVTIPWAPWLGVVVFGIGVYFHFSAPPKSLPWLMFVLLIAFAAQQVARLFFNNEISGFFGSLVATPLAYLVQMRFKGPPAMVTFLPSFWLLVPGALGLVSVTRMLSDRAAGLDSMVTVIFAIASIALGTLMGASIYKGLTERFGSWQLQIGRVGFYFSRRTKG